MRSDALPPPFAAGRGFAGSVAAGAAAVCAAAGAGFALLGAGLAAGAGGGAEVLTAGSMSSFLGSGAAGCCAHKLAAALRERAASARRGVREAIMLA